MYSLSFIFKKEIEFELNLGKSRSLYCVINPQTALSRSFAETHGKKEVRGREVDETGRYQ